MDKREFKKLCPNLSDAISNNLKEYVIYGIKFKSHTPLTLHDLYQKYEPSNSLRFYRTNYLIEKQFMIGLN
jgi:hypothetical protein